MFLWVVPVTLAGFVVAWFLKEVPLRDSARADASDVGEGFSVPDSADRVVLLERAIAATMRAARAEGPIGPVILADAGTDLSRGQAWALGQVYLHNRIRGQATLDAIARVHRLPDEVIAPVFAEVREAGYIGQDGPLLTLTPAGQAQIDRIKAAWRRWLDMRLDDWDRTDPTDRMLLDQALESIATKLLDQDVRELVPAH